MTEQGSPGAFFSLRYWEPATRVEIGCHVTSVAEVAAHADRAARIYRAEGADCLPGLSLWRGRDLAENSLSLAIGPTHWAIVHTDADFYQTVTRGPRSPRQTRQRVRNASE